MAKVSVSSYTNNNLLEDGVEIGTVKDIFVKYDIPTNSSEVTVSVDGKTVEADRDGSMVLRDEQIVSLTKHYHKSGR